LLLLVPLAPYNVTLRGRWQWCHGRRAKWTVAVPHSISANKRKPRGESGSTMTPSLIVLTELLKLQKNGQFPYESCCLLWNDESKANIKPIYECRCNGRLQTKRSTRLSHTEPCCLLWNDETKGNIKPIYECRCTGRLQTKRSTLSLCFGLLWIDKARAKDKSLVGVIV
jgi:hypothetical protein